MSSDHLSHLRPEVRRALEEHDREVASGAIKYDPDDAGMPITSNDPAIQKAICEADKLYKADVIAHVHYL